MTNTAIGFDDLAGKAQKTGPQNLAVLGAAERNILQASARACREGLAAPVLFGDREEITRIAGTEQIDIEGCIVEHVPRAREAAEAAMTRVKRGEIDVVMKGTIATPDLMHIVLGNGLRHNGRLLSHVAVFESERLGRLMMMSDSGLIPYPTLEQRVRIIKNAVFAMRMFGVPEPKVALLSSTEKVDEKIPCSVHAARLKEMARPGGELYGYGIIDGPMDFLSALDAEAARIKGIDSPVAGRGDILHSPDVVSGNLVGKAAMLFSPGIRSGGCVVGGEVPLVLWSRAATAEDKYCSILMGLVLASR